MQQARIVRVFVASPGDVAEERMQACEVIRLWNAANSYQKAIIIEPVLVESHGQSMQGGHPQDLINAQLLERCDLLIAILWHRLGTPTITDMSGTVQEIREFSDSKGHKRVMIFFCSKDLPQGFDRQQYDALMDFKNTVQSSGIYSTYKTPDDFSKLFRHQLDMAINELKIRDLKDDSPHPSRKELSSESCTLLAAGSLAGASGIIVSSHLNGTEIFANGVAYSDPENARSEANWRASIEELAAANLIRDEGRTGEIYSLTKLGYEQADKLWLLLVLRLVEQSQSHQHDYVSLDRTELFKSIGQKIPPLMLQEKASELERRRLAETVPSDARIIAIRISLEGRQFLRANQWLKFAYPDR